MKTPHAAIWQGPTHRTPWQVIGWGLVLLVVWLSLTPRPPVGGGGLSDKLGHFAAYFTLTLWFAQIHARLARIALAMLALGAALEGLQGLTGYRDMSALDLCANSLGAGLAWLLASRLPNLARKIEDWLR